MATTINGTTGRNSSYWRYFLICTEQDVNTPNNTSKLKVDVYLGATSYSRAVRGNISAPHTINVNGTDYTFNTGAYTIEKNTDYLLGSITTNAIQHDADGSKTVTVTASSPDLAQASGYGPYSGSASGTVTLTKIARYATGVSISVASKTVNSVTVNWSANETLSAIKYGTSASSLTEKTVSAKSGSFTITGLIPETAYTIYFNAKRSDSGLYLTSNVTTSVTTYAIAKLVSVPNVNIGSPHTITWTNPSGATTSLKLCKTDNTEIQNIGTVTGTSKQITPTASLIYPLTPNSNTYTARYIITTTANSTSYTNYKDFVFTVVNSNPIFSTYTYADINSKTIELTGNNQILIKGYSSNQVIITPDNRGIAQNNATMASYKLVQGSKSTSPVPYSETDNVVLQLNNVDNNVMTVYATDSRGNSTAITNELNSELYKDYSELTIKTVTATRQNNGVGQEVILKFDGEFWDQDFGNVINTVKKVTYLYKETNATEYTQGTDLPIITNNNKYYGEVSIQGDLGGEGFDASKSFNIRVVAEDELSTKNYDVIIASGTPAIAIYKDNVAIGQKYDTSEGSKLQVNGDINIPYKDTGEGSLKSGGEVVLHHNSTGCTVVSGTGDIALRLRPNGNDDATGQATLSKDGTFTATQFTGPLNGNASTSSSVVSKGIVAPESGTTKTTLAGISMQEAYSNNYPSTFGNVLNLRGKNHTGCSQLLLGWEGTALRGRIYYRSLRDTQSEWSSWGHITTAVTLYSNSSGTTGTVTLSESSANFSYLEIYYFSDLNNDYGMRKIESPNGKKLTVEWNEFPTNSTASGAWTFGTRLSISGNSISVYNTTYGIINLSTGEFVKQNRTKIYKVVGYR